MRAYLDLHQNFFPSLEEKVEVCRRDKGLDVTRGPAEVAVQLRAILKKDYNIEVVRSDFTQVSTSLENLFYYLKSNGKDSTLYLHQGLGSREEALILARELGYVYLKLNERPMSSIIQSLDSFQQLLNHFSASYFASGLLIPEREFVTGLKKLFKAKAFDGPAMKEWALSYASPVESVFHRMTQLLPRELGIDHLFFLRLDYEAMENRFQVVRELHLAERHNPHKISGNEHYCRRWLTTRLLEKMQAGGGDDFSLGCQKSHFRGSDTDYLAWSMAFKKDVPNGDLAAITVGVLINKKVEETISYLSDPNIPAKETAESCERCELTDCAERAAPFNPKMDPLRPEKIRQALSQI